MNEHCPAGIDAETLSAWRSRLLAPHEQRSITAHVADCAACQRVIAGFERIAQVLRTPPRMPSQDATWRGVQASIRSSRGNTMTSSRSWAIAGLSTALVVAISFAVLFVLIHPHTGTTPPVSTATAALTQVPTATTAPTRTLAVTEFSVPAGISPDRIIAGPDGNLWFTDFNQLSIGRLTPQGVATLFRIPSAQVSSCCGAIFGRDDITVGPGGNLWFTEGDANKIGRVTPDGVFTEFPLPAKYEPSAIASGADGNLWIAGADSIVRMTPQGAVTEFPIPSNGTSDGQPIQAISSDITSGPDGNLWFTEMQGDHIGRITLQGSITQFPLPDARTDGYDITKGPDGNLWFTYDSHDNGTQHNIRRITPHGTITVFPSLAPDVTGLTDDFNIRSGPDGNLWVTNGQGGLVRITPRGASTTFTSSSFVQNNRPLDIAIGPDSHLWITESDGKIGRLNVNAG